MPISGVNQSHTNTSKRAQIQMEAISGEFATTMECLVLPSITVPIPQMRIETGEMVMLKDVQLADPDYNIPGNIDLLIGAGLYWKMLIGPARNRISNQPALQNTRLGWIIGGELHSSRGKANDQTLTCLAIANEQLQQHLECFWKIENFPEVKHYTTEERICEKHFEETTYRNEDGRFVVRLPLRSNVKLGESKNQALRRLESLQRRLQRNMKLRESYSRFMDEYETSGYMTQISEAQLSQAEEVYFIPHAVIKPDSLSTKLRVVFDASAKTTSGSSLNDKLLPGPNLQRDLLKLLIRFRIHQYVITADIAQMFRQVLIDSRDRRLQLILWRQDSEERPRIYQLNTVTYGTASAPYHVMRCLLELATQHQEEYPAAAKAIREDFYMDDVLSGERTYQGIIELQRHLFDLLKRGQFMLRKWRSNEPQVLQQFQRQETDDLLVIDRDTTKTLGLRWCSSQDCLQYKVDLPKQGTLTKRVVLSRISQIFDPLGLVGPILIRGKIFMQKLWAEDLQWDQPLPHRYLAKWHDYWESLSELDPLQYRGMSTQTTG